MPPVDFVLNWTSVGLNDFPKGRRKYQAQTTSGFHYWQSIYSLFMNIDNMLFNIFNNNS